MTLKIIISVLLLYAKLSPIWCFCQEKSPEKTYTIDSNLTYPYKSFMYNGSLSECDCDEKACIRKCCEENYVFVDNMCVYNNTPFSIGVYQGKTLIDDDSLERYIITGIPKCPKSYYRLEPALLPEDEFYLQKEGSLWIPDEKHYISLDTHCMESTDNNIWALVCVPSNNQPEKAINTAGMMISMPFLLATFIIYALLPEKNIHGKSLMCYVLSLLLAYVLLCIINSKHMDKTICITTALACLYFFTVSFFWMSAMSIDIWWTFRGSRDYSGNTKADARKQFAFLNLYAWGVPSLLVLIVGLVNTFSDVNSWYNPKIGDGVCWIKGSVPELMYFYAPLAFIIVLNLVLFGITAFKIRKLQKDTAMLRSAQFKKHNEEERKRFKLYINLSLAMGVNWIMEIVSWAVDWQVGSVPRPVWYLTDLCNAMYGVIIFFIFTCKKKIWITLKTQYACFQDKNKPRASPCTTMESGI